jgi:chromate transporter
MALATAWTQREIVWLFLAAGIVTGALAVTRQRSFSTTASLAPLALMSGSAGVTTMLPPTLSNVFWLFAQAGAVVFGSGLAIVPFLYGELVQGHGWLNDRQFLDAVAVAMITPGPVVITVAFIGYLVAGTLGAVAAAAGVFAPVYVVTVALAPRYERWKGDGRVRAFVDGVTAAATGAIAGAAFVLGRRAVFDVPTALICLATLFATTRLKSSAEPLLILAAGVLGIAVVTLGP